MKMRPSIYLALTAFLLIFPFNVYSETGKTKNIFETKDGQIIINSISFDLDRKDSIFAFTGDVEVSRGDMNMSCQKLELYFKESLKDSSDEDIRPSLEKIVATESVVITGPEVGNATADKAVYYPDSEKIVLTGNPYIKYGDKYEGGGTGTIITLNLKEETLHVQGTKENKVTGKTRVGNGEDER